MDHKTEICRLADGATIAYHVLNSASNALPLVLVNGWASLMSDWEPLASCVAQTRPVLVFDHRGIGESTFVDVKGDDTTIESMARDLLELLRHLKWQRLALCGSSIGGAVVQQLLLLPYHPVRPTPLPFEVKHVVLANTMGSVPPMLERQPPRGDPNTEEGRLKNAMQVVETIFDPEWINDPKNADDIEGWARQFAKPRQKEAIAGQTKASRGMDFGDLHAQLPRDMQFLVIHGTLDSVVPYSFSEEIVQKIPWARRVEVGSGRGQIPHYDFGHQWYGYFDVERWRDVIEAFLKSPARSIADTEGRAKL
ncbi:alpha/beta-hydrolase [Schizophyllum commune H4-8]|nr:alpha/beta-hydrolase [Schizophyllum commune H4-8]KAI5893670.1 alpha/beta-hydrolase [Schizophyllum commune H4-8]